MPSDEFMHQWIRQQLAQFMHFSDRLAGITWMNEAIVDYWSPDAWW